jgi:tRNA A37 threonylcarbamoyladenosine dehydratase
MSDPPPAADPRFAGIARLYGPGAARLATSHVLVVGVGGVGSWTAEALARTGVGRITLLDGDEICVTNVSRQVHALDGVIGRPKVEVLAERLRAIHPAGLVHAVAEFFRIASAERHLAGPFDFVVDAIDGVTPKAALIAGCRERGWPVVTCGGAGGKTDPTQVRVQDLADTSNDRLLFFLRKKLRSRFGFPSRGKFHIPCVCSPEPVRWPDGCAAPPEEDPLLGEGSLNCDGRLGSASFLTGVIGFHAAAVVVNHLAREIGDAK